DSNIIIRSITTLGPNPYRSLVTGWLTESIEVHTPSLLRFEVTSALWRIENTGQSPPQSAEQFLEIFGLLSIRYNDHGSDHASAVGFARRFKLSKAYDAHFLAVAERIGAPFWTADERLVKAVGNELPWVNLVQ
ncbi:MAG TPA: type II toxin-antitoxin system VapC family toxin, partial [Thermomicrobiales bacterium]|nr:type II toxin-antitoxin system VapC family toxin [Thermomicrobiales bacterium]